MSPETQQILTIFENHRNEDNLKGMARFGINTTLAFGLKIPLLRELAKQYKKNQTLAIELWQTGYHEARILASMVADPSKLDESLMDNWVHDFNSWDLCDQTIMNLFEKRTDLAYPKLLEWVESEAEFIKRAGFVLMARLAFTDKKADDQRIIEFLDILIQKSNDKRNFVKKANNWALRQIGKRSLYCNKKAIECAHKMLELNKPSSKWIATDALRELQNVKVIERLMKKENEGNL